MALLQIQNDIASSIDKGILVLLVLDLSTAFDTIVNSILFDCLKHCFGIDGVVLMKQDCKNGQYEMQYVMLCYSYG